jgi:hypothetical protein
MLLGYLAAAILVALVWAMWPPLGFLCAAILVLGLVVRPVFYFRWLNSHDPRSRELVKACHGAGFIVVGICVLGLTVETGGDRAGNVAALCVAPFALWGLLWLLSSGYFVIRSGSAGALDNAGLVRGALKFVAGVAINQYNPFSAETAIARILSAPDFGVLSISIGILALSFVASWCMVTGAAKVLLLLLAKIRLSRSRAPAPMENPHGTARAATRDESRRAGEGNKSALDRQKF